MIVIIFQIDISGSYHVFLHHYIAAPHYSVYSNYSFYLVNALLQGQLLVYNKLP